MERECEMCWMLITGCIRGRQMCGHWRSLATLTSQQFQSDGNRVRETEEVYVIFFQVGQYHQSCAGLGAHAVFSKAFFYFSKLCGTQKTHSQKKKKNAVTFSLPPTQPINLEIREGTPKQPALIILWGSSPRHHEGITNKSNCKKSNKKKKPDWELLMPDEFLCYNANNEATINLEY